MDQKTIQDLSSSGLHQECLQVCQQLLQTEPENPIAWKYAGKSLLALGQLEKSKNCLMKANQIDNSDPEIIKDLGNYFLHTGDFEKASEAYHNSLVINAEYAPAINNLGRIAQQQGQHEKAIELFQKAYALEPSLIQAALGSAKSAISIGSWDLAVKWCNQVLKSNLEHPGLNLLKGIALQNKGDLKNALRSYQNELSINPMAVDAYLNAAFIHLKLQNPLESEKLLIKVTSLRPEHNEAKLILAQVKQKLEKWQEAVNIYQLAAFSEDVNAMIPFNLGLCLLELKREKDAYSAFVYATKKDPNFGAAWGNIGNYLKDIVELEKAYTAYTKVLEIDPKSAEALNAMADIKRQEGNRSEGIALLKKALIITPTNYKILTNTGLLLCEDGQYEMAIEMCLKSISINPDYPDSYNNLALSLIEQGKLEQALAATLKSIELKPDNPTAHVNLGAIYKDLGNLAQALASTLKSLELKPDKPTALVNLGAIYKDLGNLDQALASTLKSLELKPDNPDALINLGWIYQDLGNIDQALNSTLKSLEIKPGNPGSLYSLGRIKIVQGKTKEARKYLLDAVKSNPQEYGAYYELSIMIASTGEAEELIRSAKSVNTPNLTPQRKLFIEFALSNCFHKLKDYDQASKHLKIANDTKLMIYPSNAGELQEAIGNNISRLKSADIMTSNANSGQNRIFIVGMPRSGSTLLETILSMNPAIKDLGESRSLKKAITIMQEQSECDSNQRNLDKLYSQLEYMSEPGIKYTVDKNLYNFIYIGWIAAYMPAAKIIHCRRNPLDNILSMYRSNFSTGNDYTSNLKDAARILIAHEQAMKTYKERHPKQILTFDYDEFVNAPEPNLLKLLEWLELDFDQRYLHPEKSTRTIHTASSIEARKPINNKSVGGRRNYENLLKPAKFILHNNGFLQN